jgi:hypothetical protein
MKTLGPLTLLALACFVAGCPHERKEPVGWYHDSTQSMGQVVEDVNRNNQAVPTLWARVGYTATVVDAKKRKHTVGGDGVLLYRTPRDMRLVANMTAVGTVFEVGSLSDRYWLVLKPEMETMWWGYHRNVGKPCVSADLPIPPYYVVEVLGVGTIDTNFNTLPAPTMRVDHERHKYAFVWNAKLPDRWFALKEVWYDLQTKLPERVLLYDSNGRVVLRALLSNHRPVEINGQPRDRWPKVATKFNLFFPDNGTVMDLDLTEVMLDRRGSPTRRGIDFPDPLKAGVKEVIQVDKACEGE